jgi:hypothetical protein
MRLFLGVRKVSGSLVRAAARAKDEWSASAFQFDDETWEAIVTVARGNGSSFQELADEAFADLLKKHKQP